MFFNYFENKLPIANVYVKLVKRVPFSKYVSFRVS